MKGIGKEPSLVALLHTSRRGNRSPFLLRLRISHENNIVRNKIGRFRSQPQSAKLNSRKYYRLYDSPGKILSNLRGVLWIWNTSHWPIKWQGWRSYSLKLHCLQQKLLKVAKSCLWFVLRYEYHGSFSLAIIEICLLWSGHLFLYSFSTVLLLLFKSTSAELAI